MSVFADIQAYAGPRKWKYIIIHHSATPDGKLNDWQAIKDWHTGKTGSSDPKSPNYNPYKAKPDLDIGYHFGIEYVDGILACRTGRSLDLDGAHCVGKNKDSIGICVVGNFDKMTPNHQQFFMLASLCRELMRKFNIPDRYIYPHRDYAPKTCPGTMFDMNTLQNYIQGEYT